MPRNFSRPIFWPLVLIALGVLWLLSSFNVIAELNFWVLLPFWPVLLIAAGLDLIVRQRWPMASNLIALVTVALAVAAVVWAPQLGLASAGGWWSWVPFVGGTPGSGRVITASPAVSGFNAVSFDAIGDLVIQPDDEESLVIEAEDNVLAEIRTSVQGGTLTIAFANEGDWARVRPTRPVRFTLTVKQLSALTLGGAGNVTVQGLRTENFKTTLSGAGNLALQDLEATQVSCNLTGAGNLEAAGQAQQLDVLVSGVGSYKGSNLQSDSAQITLSGAGSAVVWATQNLDVNISGVGSVSYYGDPTVTQASTGASGQAASRSTSAIPPRLSATGSTGRPAAAFAAAANSAFRIRWTDSRCDP